MQPATMPMIAPIGIDRASTPLLSVGPAPGRDDPLPVARVKSECRENVCSVDAMARRIIAVLGGVVRRNVLNETDGYMMVEDNSVGDETIDRSLSAL
jgi:hypothetical protein